MLLEQAARRALQHQALEVAAPEARVDHVGAAREQRRDLGAELAGHELRHLRGLDLDAGLERLHRGLEVGPGILTPGIVLIDAGDRLHVRQPFEQIERDRDVIHGAVRAGAEHVLVACVLEDARRAAVEQHRELLELLGDRRDRQAVAARNVADDEIDARREAAELGDLLLRAARLVDDDELDRVAAKTFLRVGRGQGAGVEHLGGELGGVARRHAERAGCRPRHEGDDADAHRLLRGKRRGARREPGGRYGGQQEMPK